MPNAQLRRLVRLSSASALLLLGCTVIQPTHVGSGVLAEETRSLPAFERLGISAPARVTVTTGPSHQVRLAYDDNLLPHVETVVAGGELEIRLADGASYRSSKTLVVEVVTPVLSGLSIAGSAVVEAEELAGAHFDLSVAGSGKVRAGGAVDELEVSIAGSGELNLGELVAQRANVDIAGSGDVVVHALEALNVSVAGSGKVRYRGQPAVTSSMAGSGSVTALGP
jgi:hypothetical protein